MKGRVFLSILSYSCAVKVAKLSHGEALASFSEKVFDPETEDPDVGRVMHKVADHVDLASALKTVQHKDLPVSVAHLVQSASEGKSDYDEASLTKARAALNELVEKAWIELDDKIIKCKGFQEMNRENFAQVNRDISRVVAEISDLERVEAQSIDGISSIEAEITEAEAMKSKEEQAYNEEKAANDAELKIRESDLEVFQFILEFTKCDDSASLLQTSYQVCQMSSGRRTLLFQDQRQAKKFKTMLQPSSRRSLDSLLSTMATTHAPQATSFFQMKSDVLGEDGLPCASAGMGDEDECMKSCSPEDTPDCGLLHDKLSLMWGEYKDSVDELSMEIAKNEDKWNELKESLNAQIGLLSNKKAKLSQLLSEATANLNLDRQEKKDKNVEKRTLDEEYQAYMKQCKKRIEWIMYQDMCSIKVVRNALMESSTDCPTSSITDCDVSAWVREECSVSCDDECDPRKPFECGGWQKINRDIVEVNDECGIKCPSQSKYMRCGQYKCAVDCEMSAWTGWSACSADCEGGVKTRTRSVLVKRKNGGEQCNTPSDSEPCHTESCDRDCKLGRWTRWTPCSVACGGGMRHMRKHVLIPTRGDGKCPITSSRLRYRERECNRKECQGDEVCTANQDLVVAVDGSGSVQESGFDILKKFAETVISRYQTKYYGRERVKIGICQFGNGEIMADGKTITPAISVQPLTSSKSAVMDAVKGLAFKKGFTNMAQAFATAEDMFTKNSRRSAYQAVLVISDGKPSFAFETTSQVEQLDEKSIMRYFVVVSDQGMNSNAMTQIKSWASQPWSTNVVHVPGLDQLDGDISTWAQKAVTKFCPQSYSPGKREEREHSEAVQKVYAGGYCRSYTKWRWGRWTNTRNRRKARQRCKALADSRGHQGFFLGHHWWWLWHAPQYGFPCWTVDMSVTPAQYDQWFQDKANPACAAGWQRIWWLDMYAIYPKDDQVCTSMGIPVNSASDCTGKEIWHWKGGTTGFDENEWDKEAYDLWGGTGTCVSYAKTKGRTCKQYCEAYGKTCTRGQDDAHHQVNDLNKWLQGQALAGTKCTANDDGHERQSTEENGCLQQWNTQICACK